MAIDTQMTHFETEIPLDFPQNTVGSTVFIHDSARRLPLHVLAGSGAGKSLFGGRLAFWDFLRGLPQVVIDASGGTIDAFINELRFLPEEWIERLAPRIRYTSLSATDYVDPSPLLDNPYNESLMAVIQRHIDVILMSDPHLLSASREGFNALKQTYSDAGRVGLALGGQLPEIIDIVRKPGTWNKRFEEALSHHPEILDAVDALNEYKKLKPEIQRRSSGSFLNKTFDILAFPELNARFCTTRPGLTMQEVEDKRITWLIDGRNLKQKWLLLWYLKKFTDHAIHRGMRGRTSPIGLMLDEITELLGFSKEQNGVMESVIEQLISVISRNYGVFLTIMHQSLQQIESERIRAALMSMPNQVIGYIHDPEDRKRLAEQFVRYDPFRVKEQMPVWMSVSDPLQQEISHSYSQSSNSSAGRQGEMYGTTNGITSGVTRQVKPAQVPHIIDYQKAYYTIEEQLRTCADQFQPGKLNALHFLTRFAQGEGKFSTSGLQTVRFPVIDGQFPDERINSAYRDYFKKRDGYPVMQLVSENNDRLMEARKMRVQEEKKPLDAKISTPTKLPDEHKTNTDIPEKRRTEPATKPAADDAWEETFYEPQTE